MPELIFIVRDGPEDKPNRFYRCRVLGVAESNRFYHVAELLTGEIRQVHHHNIGLDWSAMHDAKMKGTLESLSHPGRAAPVPGAVGTKPEGALPGGVGCPK